jgi:D-aminopeptidase
VNSAKVLISADMEGISGVTALRQISSGESEYSQASRRSCTA